MTRDEVRELIAKTSYAAWWDHEKSSDPWFKVAEAVLAAFAARGIVLAEIATYTSDIDMKPIRERELALVRVVPND